MVQSNEVTERFAFHAFIFAWAVVFCIFQWVGTYNKTTNMEKQLADSNLAIEGYREELAEYRSLLDTEIDKNSQLSDTIADLEAQLSDIANELDALKEEKAAFEEQHKDCRPPIGYSKDNVLIPSNLTGEELALGLQGNLKSYAQCFVEMEEEYGINAIFLSSIAALESGWCSTNIALKNNNLFGLKKTNGSGFQKFSSKEDSIKAVSQILKNSYLTESGSNYNGLSITAINIKYCEQKTWAGKVDTIANGIIEKLTSI